MSTTTTKAPISLLQLEAISRDACSSVLSLVSLYDHTKAPGWNGLIVNKILQSLASHSTTSNQDSRLQYKYAVNSTIIQHLEATPATAESGTGFETPDATPEPTSERDANNFDSASRGGSDNGRRGMHSATGAFWNNETDGMWSLKWEGGEKYDMDVVILVIWVSV